MSRITAKSVISAAGLGLRTKPDKGDTADFRQRFCEAAEIDPTRRRKMKTGIHPENH